MKCPFCAEEIQPEAILCRFCGHNLPDRQDDLWQEFRSQCWQSLSEDQKAYATSVLNITPPEKSSDRNWARYSWFFLIVFIMVVIFLPLSTRLPSSTQLSSWEMETDVTVLELLNWSWQPATTKYANIIGEVKNISQDSLQNAQVLVQVYDVDDNLIDVDSGWITHNPLRPGQISPFSVLMIWNSEVARAAISFKDLQGRQIFHREKPR